MTRRGRGRQALHLVALGLVLSACGDGSVDPASSPSSADSGIGVEEARSADVLHGRYDAVAVPLGGDDEQRSFEIRNLGSSADRYRVSATNATVTPRRLTLDPGESARVSIRLEGRSAGSVELVVRSDGLDGAELVRIPADWTG